MSPGSPDADVLRTLSRRADVLSCLEADSRRKRDLVDALSVSRSTVDRAVRELERLEFVERREDGYRLSVAGRLALEEHRRRVEALDSIVAVGDLLGHVPRSAPMSVRMLDGAAVHEPESHAPNEPYEVIVDRFEGAERVRGLAAAERVPRFRNRLHDLTVEGALDAEAVFTDELADFFFANHRSQMRDSMRDGGFDLYATDRVPYGLWIVDAPAGSEAFVVVHGDSADIRGVIHNADARAVEWAAGVYRRFRDRARELEAPS